MFGNRMLYTQSPGGQRRGLIYQSGGSTNKDAIGCLYSIPYIQGIEAFQFFINLTKSGKTSFFIRCMSENFNLGFHKSMIFNIDGWVPIDMIEPIKLTINGSVLDFKDIDFTTEHIKVKLETFTVTNYLDNSTYTKDMLVVYLNKDDLYVSEETSNMIYYRCENVFESWQVIQKSLPGKYFIYEGKDNNLVTEVEGVYYTNIKDGCRYVDPSDWSNVEYRSINWNMLNKYSDTYSTKFKITYTGDYYYRPYDKYIPTYELNYSVNRERNIKSNYPLIISKLFFRPGGFWYDRDNTITFNPFKMNTIGPAYPTGASYFQVFYKNDPLHRSDFGFQIEVDNDWQLSTPIYSSPNSFMASDYTPAYGGTTTVQVKGFRCDSYSFEDFSDFYPPDDTLAYFPKLNVVGGWDGAWCIPDNLTQSGYLQLQSFNEKFIYPDRINH